MLSLPEITCETSTCKEPKDTSVQELLHALPEIETKSCQYCRSRDASTSAVLPWGRVVDVCHVCATGIRRRKEKYARIYERDNIPRTNPFNNVFKAK